MRGRTAQLCGALVLALLVGVGGCDAFKKLRAAFHPDEGEAEEFGKAGLRVEVIPPDGISILLDDRRVASVSPWEGKKLKAGPHRLEVRAMGYHTVVLPLELKDGEVLKVPVALRERDVDEPPEPQPPPGKPTPGVREAPPAPAPTLPPGVKPIELVVAARPAVPVLLDQVKVRDRTVQLQRTHGVIRVGVATITYRVGSAGILVLTVADDDATWSRDGRPLRSGGSFKLHKGAARLRRVGADGTDQTVLLRR